MFIFALALALAYPGEKPTRAYTEMPLDRIAEFAPLPPASGKPLEVPFGANLPFLYYGDIGCNAWGCRGLSTEGFIAKRGFVDIKRVASNPISGKPALAITANITAQSQGLSSGEVSTEPAVTMPVACPKTAAGTLLNLEGVTVRYRLCFPPGSAGPENARNGVQFVFKSRTGDAFPSLYSDWINIDPAWEGKCADLTFRVSNTGPGQRFGPFDATKVTEVGFLVAANPAAAGARIQGDFYLESLVLETNPAIAYDFEVPLVEKQLRAMRDLSVRLSAAPPLVRVFTLVDGRAGIVWGSDGSPQSLDQWVFRDFDTLFNAAERADVRLIPVLLDFHWASKASVTSGVQLGGRSNVIRNSGLRQKFLSNVLEPILQRYGNHPSIHAWEIMNEPEWVTSGIDGFRPDTQHNDPVALNDIREFFRVCAEAIRRLTSHDVTIGSARRSWVSLWKDSGVTLHSWHYYDSDTQEPFPWRPKAEMKLDLPVLITEVPTANTRNRAGDYLRAARQGGYDGLCLWSCRAQDTASDFPAAAADLTGRIPQVSAVLNAASYSGESMLAPDAWVTLFGANLAPSAVPATVSIQDSGGEWSQPRVSFASPGQINCLVPPNVRTGPAKLTVSRLDGGAAVFDVQVGAVAPGLFTANADGKGVAAALVTRVAGGRVVSTEPVFRCDPSGKNCTPLPFRFGPEGEEAILILFGTGIRHRSDLAAVTVQAGGRRLSVTYAGAQHQYDGLDQVNAPLPRDLAGGGLVTVELTVDGWTSNASSILIE